MSVAGCPAAHCVMMSTAFGPLNLSRVHLYAEDRQSPMGVAPCMVCMIGFAHCLAAQRLHRTLYANCVAPQHLHRALSVHGQGLKRLHSALACTGP